MKLLMAAVTSIASAALVLAIVATFNAADDNSSAESATPPAAGGTAAGEATPAAAQVMQVELGDLFIRPETIEVATGAPAVLEVTNGGGIQHDLRVEGVGQTPLLDAGTATRLDLGNLEPGTYKLLCTVPGHADAGMRASLVVAEGEPGDEVSGGDSTAADHGGQSGHGGLTVEEMDRLHVEGVESFPVTTTGRGGQLLEPTIDKDGVKVFELTASEIEWEVEPGVFRDAMAYNGMVPGPEIRVQLGDRVRVILHNEMSQSTVIHYHGLVVPNAMDGVPGLTQDPVKPGESFTYEFTIVNSGSHMYHSHHNSAVQVTSGLLGAFVVEDPETDTEVDQDLVMILNDGPLGYTINGKGFPATQPIVARQGERIRIRYMNEGLQVHPMHLHGIPQQVVARDGYPVPEPYMADTILVAPGERVDVLVDATELGAWAFHCHILTHAEAEDGMFGMVTALIVE